MFTLFFRLTGLLASAWARASGMYSSGALLPGAWPTTPITVNLAPAIVTADPVFSPCAAAYTESATATAASACPAANARPETSRAAASGPSCPWPRSTPVTLTWTGGWKLDGGGALSAGIVPLISVSTSPPAAALTSRSRAMAATADASSVPWVGLPRVSECRA